MLDDLSTGFLQNVPDEAELIEGQVSDPLAVAKAVDGVELVIHLAAHRAVLRSVEDPLATDTSNTHGTLTVLKSALDAELYGMETASFRYLNVFRAPPGRNPPMPQ